MIHPGNNRQRTAESPHETYLITTLGHVSRIAALTVLLGAAVLANAHAQDSDEDIVDEFDTVLDGVEEALREGETDAEAGRGVLESVLDFFGGIVLGAYDAAVEFIAGSDGEISLESYQELVTGMTIEQLVEALGEYSNSSSYTVETTDAGDIIVTEIFWEGSEGVTITAVLHDGELSAVTETGLE